MYMRVSSTPGSRIRLRNAAERVSIFRQLEGQLAWSRDHNGHSRSSSAMGCRFQPAEQMRAAIADASLLFRGVEAGGVVQQGRGLTRQDIRLLCYEEEIRHCPKICREKVEMPRRVRLVPA